MIPHVRIPVKVNFSMTRSNRLSSISFSTDRALEANWMGPPNRAKADVFSYTVTSKPALSMQRAAVSPPTPPPAMATLRGRPGRAGRPSRSSSSTDDDDDDIFKADVETEADWCR